MHLVLIETGSNQRYIFSTNRRRENVGASEIVLRAGTRWVLEELRSVDKRFSVDPRDWKKQIRDEDANRPIEKSGAPEVVYLSSGKALLMVPDRQTGQELVSRITTRALREAPGLSVTGVVSDRIDPETATLAEFADAVRQLFLTHERLRSTRQSPAARSLRLPIVASCTSSGLPAETMFKDPDGRTRPRSLEASSKADPDLINDAYARMGWARPRNDADDEEESWAAIVHADGNGFGRVFLRFEQHGIAESEKRSWRNYVRNIREFSIKLDEATLTAFDEAVSDFGGVAQAGVLPLILGGDDLTIVCNDATIALDLAKRYLESFERVTRDDAMLTRIAQSVFGVPRLTQSAGVLFIKPHFPFSTAYTVTEGLTHEAKQECRARGLNSCSAISTLVMYDSTASTLEEIRARQRARDGSRLYGSPFIVSPADGLATDEVTSRWLVQHSYEKLARRIAAIRHSSNGKRVLPSSQLSAWRAAAEAGREYADSAYRLARHRYDRRRLSELEGDDASLFWTEAQDGAEHHVTALADLIALERLGAKIAAAGSSMPEATEGGAR